jgi:hypothetical protein
MKKINVDSFENQLHKPIEMSIALGQAQCLTPKIADVENAGVIYAP